MTTEAKKTAEPEQDPRDAVIVLLVGILLYPFTGMLHALTYRLLWNWFVAPQYGAGPTLETWFGVGILVTLLTYRYHAASKKSAGGFRLLFEDVLMNLLLLGCVIVAAAVARLLWGWR